MEKILLIILICIIVALIAYRGGNKRREEGQMQVPINNKNEMNIDDRIEKLILQKQMFTAVKEYRTATGVSLMEAKNHVDALAEAIKEGKQVDVDEQPEVKNDELH